MFKGFSILIGILFPLGAQVVLAQEPDKEKLKAILSDAQMDLSGCLAYYLVTQSCARQDMSEDTKTKLNAAISTIQKSAYMVGSDIGMTVDAMGARVKLLTDEDMALIKHDCVNFASLLLRDGQKCKAITEDPSRFLMQKIQQ